MTLTSTKPERCPIRVAYTSLCSCVKREGKAREGVEEVATDIDVSLAGSVKLV